MSEPTKTIKMLVYGDPGVGKTVFAASASRAIYCDIEGGSMSIQDRIDNKKIQYKRFTDFDSLENFIHGIRESGTKAETIIVDSATELQKVLMDSIVQNNPGVKRPYGDGLTVGDWGYNTERMRRFFRTVRDLPINVIFVALTQDQKNESTGAVKTIPKMSDKLSTDLCGYVDIVGYLYTDIDTNEETGEQELVRRMLFQPIGTFYAKDRSGRLGTYMDNPTFPAVYSLVYNKPITNGKDD